MATHRRNGTTGMNVDPVDVLVVGAGPTGLALALHADSLGARVRVVERRREPFRHSRALVLHPRSLEVLRPLGVNDALLERAHLTPSVCLHLGDRQVWLHTADLGLEGSAYPSPALIRQADVEAVLAGVLTARSVVVERGAELVDVAEGPEFSSAVVRTARGDERIECRFLVGCDGADSTVRGCAGIGYRGGSYGQDVLLADVELAGDIAPAASHVVAGRTGLVFVFALGERATWRLLATCDAARGTTDKPAVQLQHLLERAGLPVVVDRVIWSTRLPMQHRLATRFRRGRLLLAGDAAHVHSPAAAQGMNAGIQDATNLGWKLAAAAGQDLRDGSLLDSYELERRPVARQLIALTGAVFHLEAGSGPFVSFARGVLAPLTAPAIPFLLRRRSLVDRALRLLSQFDVNYRESPLSVDDIRCGAARLRAGDRLPDELVQSSAGSARLHDVTSRAGFHILLQSDATPLDASPLGPYVHVIRIHSWPGSGAVIVRPDGYLGMRAATADRETVTRWLSPMVPAKNLAS